MLVTLLIVLLVIVLFAITKVCEFLKILDEVYQELDER